MMAHGTSREAAFSIVGGGFGTVCAVDAGWYGQGIYFTVRNLRCLWYQSCAQNSLTYACNYDTTKGEKTVVLALVTPGNVFPVCMQLT